MEDGGSTVDIEEDASDTSQKEMAEPEINDQVWI